MQGKKECLKNESEKTDEKNKVSEDKKDEGEPDGSVKIKERNKESTDEEEEGEPKWEKAESET